MTYAFITGGLGFIGSYIARGLIVNDIVDKVVCLDHFGRYSNSLRTSFKDYRKQRIMGIEDRIIIERGDTKYQSVLYKLLYKYKPTIIIHLAALPLAKLSNLNSEEAIEGTTLSTTYFMEIIGNMDNYRPESFVYASSSMTYGNFSSDFASETDSQNPTEIYGTMKLAGEVVTNGLAKFYDIPYSIVRPSAVYGPTDMNRRVGQIFIEKALNGEEITVQGKDERLDFSYVKDVALGFIKVATHAKAKNETFNITCGNSRTLLELAEIVKRKFPEAFYKVIDRDGFRPKRGTLSIEKATKLIDYMPRYQLEDGMNEYFDFYRMDQTNIEEVAKLLNKSMIL